MQARPAGSWTPELSTVGGATPASPTPYPAGALDGIAETLSLRTSSVRSSQQQDVSRSNALPYAEDQVQQRRNAKGLSPLDPAALEQTVGGLVDPLA